MTLCRRCGIEVRAVANGAGVGWGHVSPTSWRHYPRPTPGSGAVIPAPLLSSPPPASATDTRVKGKPDQRQSRPSGRHEGHPTRGPGARASHRPASSLPGAGRKP